MNDNQVAEPEGRWEDTPRGRLVMNCASIIVIAAIAVGAAYLFDASHWIRVGLTIALLFVGMLIAAIFRLIFYGQA
ncbi:hypothetical protein LRS73_31895 [Methylobacterium currus]|uniref:hypothetical protein n=1 Tax=Methylobacterium currus TaxID=2051553 RepID=UPI001E47D87D|nr:hypothetical protein [Methylobacterium currus]UHC19460.1 hypothetical protein LRS73_31895 [Methylobacterium currus]